MRRWHSPEVLCATLALYHVSGIKYLNFYLEFLTQTFVSSLLADWFNCRDVIRHGLTSDEISSQNIHVSS